LEEITVADILKPHNLNFDTLTNDLIKYAAEFEELPSENISSFRVKLRNSTIIFAHGRETMSFSPLPWLIARIAGASWTDRNYHDWILSPEYYQPALRECGLQQYVLGDIGFENYRTSYYDYCGKYGFKPSFGNGNDHGTNRKFWVVPKVKNTPFPDEIAASDAQKFWEGAITQVFVNRIERSSAARLACIEAHDVRCTACNLDFETQYGEIGRGFIHVHHKVPLGGIEGSYQLDPLTDLVPLCPNCHAMIHKLPDPADIDELKRLLKFRFD
jgi:5-methylcytosine-specific restriction protein A